MPLERVRHVVEVHDKWLCSQCDARGWHKAIWLAPLWQPGADPVGPPAIVICDDCWRVSEVGQLVR